MISILTAGTLTNAPASRTSRNGNPFVTAQMRAGNGNEESALVSLVAFDEAVCKSLLALSKGDSIVVTGNGKPTSWTARDGSMALGLNVVISVLVTQYGLTKKRKAITEANSLLPDVSPLMDQRSEEEALF